MANFHVYLIIAISIAMLIIACQCLAILALGAFAYWRISKWKSNYWSLVKSIAIPTKDSEFELYRKDKNGVMARINK